MAIPLLSIDPARLAPAVALPMVGQELSYLDSLSPGGQVLTRPDEFLRALPKAELHLHSTAMTSLPWTARTAWEESRKSDGALQTRFGSLEAMVEYFLSKQCGSLEEYLIHYDILKPYLIRDLEVIREMSYEGAREAFQKGVRVLEIRTSIKSGKHGDSRSRDVMKGVTFTPFEELCARVEGFQQAEREFGGTHRAYLLISFRRQDDPAALMELLHDVINYQRFLRERYGREYLLGVDIAGSEVNHHAKKFEAVFQTARSEGLLVTAHAGEELGAGEGSIRQALNAGAQRIGHGTSLYYPTPMLLPEHVRRSKEGIVKNAFILALMFGTPFEMCLTSNLATGAGVTRGYQAQPGKNAAPRLEPFRDFHDYPADLLMALGGLTYQGRDPILPIPCTDGIYTLNTDIVREYALAAATFGWGVKEILAVALESLRASFAPEPEKARAMKAWQEFAKNYLVDERYLSPEAEAAAALSELRKRKRRQLRVSTAKVEEIMRHVSSPEAYFNGDYLEHRFRRHLERIA